MYRISHTCIQFHTALHQLISFHSWGHRLQDSNRQGWDGAGENVQLGVWQIKMKKMNANKAALMGDDGSMLRSQHRTVSWISLVWIHFADWGCLKWSCRDFPTCLFRRCSFFVQFQCKQRMLKTRTPLVCSAPKVQDWSILIPIISGGKGSMFLKRFWKYRIRVWQFEIIVVWICIMLTPD